MKVIFWRTIWDQLSGILLVHVVWETRGRTFGYTFAVDAARFDGLYREVYEHMKKGAGGCLLSKGCPDAKSFSREMPNSRKRLPEFVSCRFPVAAFEMMEEYISNQCKRHPEFRKPGYIWKCDE